jgi:hypothetical protein
VGAMTRQRSTCAIDGGQKPDRAIRAPRGWRDNPAVGMIVQRTTVRLIVLSLGLALGSCSQFSGLVSDHWPHWAGGEPNDVPPRPGAPGYDEFIAHKPPDSAAATPAGTAAAPTGPLQAAAPGNPRLSEPSVGDGGLY